jgi:16S rRNA C1402 (ribose-2'-O) methylase RsmI
MTKPHEEFLFGPLAELLALLSRRPKVLGEVCWGVAGARPEDRRPDEASLEGDLREVLGEGLPLRDAARVLAARRSLSVKEAYALLLAARARA